ncbi:Aste57867_9515 [Aphanomyces stellatus]|uniref:Aste57867_9515 protein n=1 Tax=Aphanomyces stellatus TaxID=120398 RepID=A0A485KN31_9STRA|nr:hypothetical protein As57867_009478 [Aphanomyces stellatus]VFT86394.1 Aste57867_9515 [Aphanomyces stellatus]
MEFPSLKLIHFRVTGRAELTRLALTVGGIPFESQVVQDQDWHSFQPSCPFHQLPVLVVDGTPMAESAPMARFAASLARLYPVDSDPLATYRIDELVAFVQDILEPVVMTTKEQDPTKRVESRKQMAATWLPGMLDLLDARLEGKTGLQVTLADLAVFLLVVLFHTDWLDPIPKTICSNHANIMHVYAKVAALPGVATWKRLYHADI